jgi:hypothetical protein
MYSLRPKLSEADTVQITFCNEVLAQFKTLQDSPEIRNSNRVLPVSRPPLPCRPPESGRARGGGGGGRSTCEVSRARVAWTPGGTRSRLRGRGSLAMEVDVEMPRAPPRAPWTGMSSSAAAHAREREAQAELLGLTHLPPCILSSLTAPPPLRPQTPSPAARYLQVRRQSTNAPPLPAAARPMLLVQCDTVPIPARQTITPVPVRPPPGPCSSSQPWLVSSLILQTSMKLAIIN